MSPILSVISIFIISKVAVSKVIISIVVVSSKKWTVLLCLKNL